MNSISLERLLLVLKGQVRPWLWFVPIAAVVLFYPIYLGGGLISNVVHRDRLGNPTLATNREVTSKDIAVSDTQLTELIDKSNLLYVTVDNKANTELGYWPWVYNSSVLDSDGKTLSTEEVTSYLLPGETKIISTTVRREGKTLKVDTDFSKSKPVFYNANANKLLKMPTMTVVSNKLENAELGALKASFSIRNDDQPTIATLYVTLIIRDTQDKVVNIGSTVFTGVAPSNIRSFSSLYVSPKDKIAKTVEIRYSVNYLDPTSLSLTN